MITVKLWRGSTFWKKANSTKRPDDADAFTVEGVFRNSDPVSIYNPEINFDFRNYPGVPGVTAISAPPFNYAYVDEFRRYYWITNWVHTQGVWTASMTVDVLATYQTDINNSFQMVERSTSDSDPDIIDTAYPVNGRSFAKAQYISANVECRNYATGDWTLKPYFNVELKAGAFVVGIVGNNETGVSYYIMNAATFQDFLAKVFVLTPSQMSTLESGLANAVFDPMQYITSCKWFPSMPLAANMPGTISSIRIAGNNINLISGAVCYHVTGRAVETYRMIIGVPTHPQTANYAYLNLSPYTAVNLYFQPFGDIPLDTAKLYGATSVTVMWHIDYCSGACLMHVLRGEDTQQELYNMSTEIGVELPVSTLTMDWKAGLALSGLNWIKNNLPEKTQTAPALGGVNLKQVWENLKHPFKKSDPIPASKPATNTDVLDKFSDMLGASLGSLHTNGTPGSFLSYGVLPYVYCWFFIQTQHATAIYGAPLKQYKYLRDLSGFCICSNAYINFNDNFRNPTAEEQVEVINALNSGVYLE